MELPGFARIATCHTRLFPRTWSSVRFRRSRQANVANTSSTMRMTANTASLLGVRGFFAVMQRRVLPRPFGARPVLALRRAGYERCPVSQAQRHSCERTSPSERADGRAVPAGCSPTRTTETSLHPAKIEQMFPFYGPAVRTRIHAAFHRRAQPSCIGLGQGGGPKRLSDADARAAS